MMTSVPSAKRAVTVSPWADTSAPASGSSRWARLYRPLLARAQRYSSSAAAMAVRMALMGDHAFRVGFGTD